MKKVLLSAAVVAMAASAFAQVEVGIMDADHVYNEVGTPGKNADDKDVSKLPAESLLVATENVEMYNYNEDEITKQDAAFNGIKTLIVNGESVELKNGIGGSNNGKGDINGPTGGWMFHFKVKKDGWLIVPSKISSNKNFYAFEGLQGADPICLAFTLGMDLQSDAYPEIPEIVFNLPADKDGYLNTEAADIDKYTFGGTAIGWPIRIATGDAEAASAGNGTGAIVFPVYADAENYLVLATGSKMNSCGFVFVDSDPAGAAPDVAVTGIAKNTEAEKTIVISGNAPGAVNAIEAANENAPIYNMMGVRVNADAKGILIQNGKKFIRK
ncbi:MAG: hypothetical protein K2G77_01260 [Muribaculaceae bacterium]|nr:hypothetical protein [Muribaculaceae bacterium]